MRFKTAEVCQVNKGCKSLTLFTVNFDKIVDVYILFTNTNTCLLSSIYYFNHSVYLHENKRLHVVKMSFTIITITIHF